MNKDGEIFEHYKKVAAVLGKMFAPFLEVVVHDLRKPKRSVIYIENGSITNRKVGDPTTDLGMKRIKGNQVPDELVNYPNQSPSGAPLKSSSLAIRNGDGKLIGSLCLNFEIGSLQSSVTILEHLLKTTVSAGPAISENFLNQNTTDEIRSEINNYVLLHGLTFPSLSKHHKKSIVRAIADRGHLRKRGAIPIVSTLLKVTRATVYNYLGDAHVE